MKRLIPTLLIVLAGCTSSKSHLSFLLSQEDAFGKAMQPAVAGCIAKGLKTDAAMSIILSGGQICANAVMGVVTLSTQANVVCPVGKDQEKCLFTAGFAKVLVGVGLVPKTKEELQAVDEELETAFQAYLAAKK